MNILVLDIYPSTNHRISKDQNGGYGTANNYGNSIFGKFLNFIVFINFLINKHLRNFNNKFLHIPLVSS